MLNLTKYTKYKIYKTTLHACIYTLYIADTLNPVSENTNYANSKTNLELVYWHCIF